jgi:hypothetical protein
MADLSEVTLQLIYKKLDEILHAIKGQGEDAPVKPKPLTQKQFNEVMAEVMKKVNKK